jgi:amino acid adenylation domain-containing protein
MSPPRAADQRADPLGADRPLHLVVAEQAQRTPERTAVVHGTTRISYQELIRRVDLLTGQLRERGVCSETLVAVCLPRTVDLLVALLATWAAGGGYVPLDPAYPAGRIEWVLADAAPRVVVTSSRLRPLVGAGAATLCLDPGRDGDPARPGRRDAAEPTAAQHVESARSLAYVIYTSGSTGRPKGVAIEHASVLALFRWAREVYSAEELTGVLAGTSVCFDLSVFELFLPLCLGGTVVLADSALALPELPARTEVTLLNTVPSVLRTLLRTGPLPPSVGVVNLAGEPLTRSVVDAAYAQPGVRRVLNLYGPSECTTYSTWAEVRRAAGGDPPVGVPVTGTRAHVLDPRGRPVAAGVPGELYLGGAGVARGYLGRPALTADRFVADPYALGTADGAPARMYRTGDLVVRRDDGMLHYLGRIDEQVKVRGFRVEPGEIEAVLARQDSVAATAVVAVAAGEDRHLVAFVQPRRRGAAVDLEALRGALADQMPDYMVPARWWVLDALPLSPSGKIDRSALRAMAATRPPRPPYVPPYGDCAAAVAGIWSEVLGVDRVGADDDFFALGGQSLLAAQLLARVASRLGVTLPAEAVFVAPTLAGFARRVEDRMLAEFLSAGSGTGSAGSGTGWAGADAEGWA